MDEQLFGVKTINLLCVGDRYRDGNVPKGTQLAYIYSYVRLTSMSMF